MTPGTRQAPLSISQTRILEWVSVSYSRGSSDPGIKAASLVSPALAGGFFTTSAAWEALLRMNELNSLLPFPLLLS